MTRKEFATRSEVERDSVRAPSEGLEPAPTRRTAPGGPGRKVGEEPALRTGDDSPAVRSLEGELRGFRRSTTSYGPHTIATPWVELNVLFVSLQFKIAEAFLSRYPAM